MANNWNWCDYDYLRKEYPLSVKKTFEHFSDTKPATIQTRALRIGACAFVPFTQEEKALAEAYGKTLGSALIFLLPNRTPSEVALLLK